MVKVSAHCTGGGEGRFSSLYRWGMGRFQLTIQKGGGGRFQLTVQKGDGGGFRSLYRRGEGGGFSSLYRRRKAWGGGGREVIAHCTEGGRLRGGRG